MYQLVMHPSHVATILRLFGEIKSYDNLNHFKRQFMYLRKRVTCE
jgi:hypothetical protein